MFLLRINIILMFKDDSIDAAVEVNLNGAQMNRSRALVSIGLEA
jgi:hypothetical protein